jgi:hypothetical protein
MSLREVVSLLTDVTERIQLTMTQDTESMMAVMDSEVDAILDESGWTREGVLNAIHGANEFNELTDLLQCAN